MKRFVVCFLLVVASISASAGCGASPSVIAVADALSARAAACRCTTDAYEVTTIARRGGLTVQYASGLSRVERECLTESLSAVRTPGMLAGARFRVRWSRDPSRPFVPGAREFIQSRGPQIAACVPDRTTRVVATPEGDRYALSVELVGDEPDLDARELACIVSALEGAPAPPERAYAEVIVMIGPGAPCAPDEAPAVR